MDWQSLMKVWVVLPAGMALFGLAEQKIATERTVTLNREIVILNDGVDDAKMMGMLKAFLTKRFGLPVRVGKNFVDLSAAYVPHRKQWDYRMMLDAVHRCVRGVGRCLLLTNKDTFGEGLNWSTGISYCNGTTAVVSVCRLNPIFWGDRYDRALHHRRVRKIVLHELGHTFGRAGHCDDWDCALHGSNSIGEIDMTGEDYCARCDALVRSAITAIKGK